MRLAIAERARKYAVAGDLGGASREPGTEGRAVRIDPSNPGKENKLDELRSVTKIHPRVGFDPRFGDPNGLGDEDRLTV